MVTALVLSVLVTADVRPPEFYAPNQELREYMLEAARNHPGLRARHDEWLAALERIPQVTSLDDPMLTYGQFLQSETSRFKVMLSQKFPWFGTLRARGDRAAAEADAALARFYTERNRVFADVKQAYFEYGFLKERLRVTESQADVVQYVEDVVHAKLSLGLATEDDVLRVSIEKAKLEDLYASLLQMRPALAARLNETLGCEVCGERPWPQEAELPPPLPPAPVILARIRVANPELTVFDHMIESRRKQAELARKSGFPNLQLGIEYVSMSKPRQVRPDRPYPASLNAANRVLSTVTGATPFSPLNAGIDAYALGTAGEPMAYSDGGEDNVMVSLSATLPIWRKRIRAGIEEGRLLESATKHARRRRTLALDSAAQMTVFNVEDAQRRRLLYRETLIPQAQRTYEGLQTRYATGALGSDLLDVLESVRTLLEFGLEEARAVRDWQVAAAELESLMGGPWSAGTGTEGSEASAEST